MADALFREQLIAVQRWLSAYDSGDASVVLAADALHAAEQLGAARAADPELASQGRVALALFWWHRFWALPPGENVSDLRLAVAQATGLDIADGQLPTELTALLSGDLDLAGIPADWADDAARLLSDEAGLREVGRIDHAVDVQRVAAQAMGPGDPARGVCLANRATLLHTKASRTGDRSALDDAIDTSRNAIAALGTAHPSVFLLQGNLALMLRTRFRSSGASADLDDAITAGRAAVATESAQRTVLLSGLGIALRLRFARSGDAPDLDEAIEAGRAAAAAMSGADQERTVVLDNLAQALLERHRRGQSGDDLDAAVDAARGAVAVPRGHNMASARSTLAGALAVRFNAGGDPADLDDAIAAARPLAGAAGGAPADGAESARLAALLTARFWLRHETGDIAAAVALLRESLAAVDDDAEKRADRQVALAHGLAALGQATGSTAALCEAVLLYTQALGPDPTVAAAQRPRLRIAAARLSAWGETGDAAPLLDDELSAELLKLGATDPRSPADLSALCLAGWLHLIRHVAGPPDAEMTELRAAAVTLRPVYLAVPDAVPAAVARLYPAGAAEAPQGEETYARLHAVAMQLLDRYNATGDLGALREGVQWFRQAAAAAASDQESVAVAHNNLGLSLLALAQRTGDAADIGDAVTAMRTSVAHSAPEQPYLPGRLSQLCGALGMLARQTGDHATFDEAVDTGRQGIALTPADHPSRGKYLSNLAGALLARPGQDRAPAGNGTDAGLREAVSLLRQAIAGMSPADPSRAAALGNLGTALRSLSERTSDLGTLSESVDVARAALGSTPQGAVRRPLLELLGLALAALYERTADLDRLHEAIEVDREMVSGTQRDDPRRDRLTTTLIVHLNTLWAATGDPDPVREAVGLLRDVTAGLADTDPAKAALLAMLGLMLPDLVTPDERTVLREAADALRAAVALVPPGSQEHGWYGKNLASALASLYQRTGGGTALDEAAQAARESVRAPSSDAPESLLRLKILTDILRTRYELTADPAEIDEAIAAADQALSLGGGTDWQVAQAEMLFLRAAGTGRLAEMRQAVTLVKDLIAQPGADHLDWANAGTLLMQYYTFTGALEELDEGIRLLRQSIETRPAESWVAKNSLASALELRRARTPDPAYLSEAIEVARAAAAEIPPTYSYRSVYLANLGGLLGQLAADTGEVGPLAEGVDALRAAVLAASAAPAYQPSHLAALAQMLLTLHQRAGDETVLAEAVTAARGAVGMSSGSASNHAKYLGILGRVLLRVHQSAGDAAALREARDVLSSAAAHPAGSLQDRVLTAEMWGDAAMLAGDPRDALRGYELAIDLMLQRAGPGLARGDREYGIEESSGLPRSAAAAAIAAGDPGRAVELLEYGRGVLLGEALQFRSDVSQLEAHDPELAARFRQVTGQLGALQWQAHGQPRLAPVADGAAQLELPRAAERRAALAAELSGITERIRAVPGFADFMRPPALAAIAAGLGPGPVAMVNVSRWRCDALLVTPDGVQVVPLPEVTLASATDRVNEYLATTQRHQFRIEEVLWLRQQLAGPDAVPSSYPAYHAAKIALDLEAGRLEETLLATMAWLWDAIAEPVLRGLGYTSPPRPGASWPRIWWCPTGPLTLLPLHAAGRHEPGSADDGRAEAAQSVIERAVSSYAPSLRALTEARRRPSGQHGDDLRMLVVAMPRTPGQSPLPSAARERDLLGQLFRGRSTVLSEAAATSAAVLSALPAHRWAHFSCHGDQDLAEPSRGGLLLADGLLTIADIGGGNYQGEFAFLSACKTGTGGITLMDEAITLASALQYAGYRHVVATLWSVYDSAAAEVAEFVYDRLARDKLLEPADTAVALHEAIWSLRRRFADRPSVWMPFTHLGP